MLSGLRSSLGPLVVIAAMAQAPFQCASRVDPGKRGEEGPGDALYGLAERFEAEGQRPARVATLRYLVERYPASRFAVMARHDLEALGEALPPNPK